MHESGEFAVSDVFLHSLVGHVFAGAFAAAVATAAVGRGGAAERAAVNECEPRVSLVVFVCS